MGKHGKDGLPKIINRSINETLSRTILTSGTTMLVVAALFLFGGGVIHTFAFALLVGILIGTYSSVFVASPLLIFWEERKGDKGGKVAVKGGAA
jgi:preprotein translocase subunit SecF